MLNIRRNLMLETNSTNNLLVDYIISNEDLYLVIDYIPNKNSRLVFNFEHLNLKSSPLFYASKGLITSKCLSVVSKNYVYFISGDYQKSSPSFNCNTSKKTLLDVNFKDDLITIDDRAYSISKLSTEYNTLALDDCINLNIFKRLDTNTYGKDIKLYSLDIYENGVLLYLLRPFDTGYKNGLINTLTGKIYTDVNGRLFKSPLNN